MRSRPVAILCPLPYDSLVLSYMGSGSKFHGSLGGSPEAQLGGLLTPLAREYLEPSDVARDAREAPERCEAAPGEPHRSVVTVS